MNALIVAHAAIRGANRDVYRALAQRDVEVTVLVPSSWRSGLGRLEPEPEPAGSPLHLAVGCAWDARTRTCTGTRPKWTRCRPRTERHLRR